MVYVIKLIFDKIILKKYAKQYQPVTTYTPNHNNDNKEDEKSSKNEYQSIVFNTNDLMSSILQFIDELSKHRKQGLQETIDDILQFLLLHVDKYFTTNYIAVDHQGQSTKEVNDTAMDSN